MGGVGCWDGDGAVGPGGGRTDRPDPADDDDGKRPVLWIFAFALTYLLTYLLTHPLPHPFDRQAPLELVQEVARTGRLPVVNFAAGGVATPADAALMMQLGMDGVFVGSGIFKSTDPAKRARAIVQAVTHYKNPKVSVGGWECTGAAWRGVARQSGRQSGLPSPSLI